MQRSSQCCYPVLGSDCASTDSGLRYSHCDANSDLNSIGVVGFTLFVHIEFTALAIAEVAVTCRRVVCQCLNELGRSKGQAAAAITGAPAAVEAAAAEDLIKVSLKHC